MRSNRSRPLLLAFAASMALASPVSAEPVEPIGENYAGFTCGFVSTNDPTGQVVQDPNTQTGEVNGGPWVVVGADSTTMSCIISVGDGIVDAGDTVVSQTGPVGTVAAPISYQVAPGQDVWLCTTVTWTYPDVPGAIVPGSGAWEGALDDPDGNPFCDLAISVEA